MKFRSLSIAAVPLAGLLLTACTSAENKLANGLIAGVVLDTTDADDGGTVDDSKKAHFSYTDNQDDTVTVKWDNGPFSGKNRTFAYEGSSSGVAEFSYESDEEEGVLFAGVGEYSGFAAGGIHKLDTTKAAVGLTHFGVDPTDIPTTGIVEYAGETGGFLVQTGSPDPFFGDADISANFGTGDVSGTFSDLAADDYGAMEDITFTGAMSNGNANYTASNIEYDGVAASGTLLGGFYGPGAVETSGVFDVTTPGGSPIRAMGGYTATSAP